VAFEYPLFLDVRELSVLIVGGGGVATRKARGLLEAGATRLRAVSPRFDEDFPAEVQRIEDAYRREYLADARLVFAATDDSAVNEQATADARAAGVWVCRADDEADFTTPALLRRGTLKIAVSTGGNPALAARLRDALALALDPIWVDLAESMQRLRPHILADTDENRRRRMLRLLAGDAAIDAFRRGGEAGLLQLVVR